MTPPLDLYVVLDRSGSMATLARTVVTEVNRLVDTVASDDGSTTVTVVAFDSTDPFDVLLDRHQPDGRPALTADDYRPGGGTPLYDAIAATLQLASRNRRADADRRRVLVAVITDGEENASTYAALEVLGKVQRRRAAGWEFLYLGVGNVFNDAAQLGIRADEVHPWLATESGTAAAFATITSTALPRHAGRRPRKHRG